MASTTRQNPTDVLILGAGPAGLAVAISLSRVLHTCIVFSTPNFRNARSKHMHGVATWEHRDPADYRAAAREDILSHYDTVSFQDVTIAKITKLEREGGTSLFQAIDEKGAEWWGRKVVLATGIKDEMLDIEGYEQLWGRKIYHCLFCHGYEDRGAPSAGILAMDQLSTPALALHVSRYANRLASKITLYTNGNPEVTKALEETISTLSATSKTSKNTTIDSRPIVKFTPVPKQNSSPNTKQNPILNLVSSALPSKDQEHEEEDIQITFSDGTTKVEAFLAHAPKFTLCANDLIKGLGVEITEQGNIKVEFPFNETSVKGVFSAGDASVMMKAVTPAIASGGAVAAGVAAQLESED